MSPAPRCNMKRRPSPLVIGMIASIAFLLTVAAAGLWYTNDTGDDNASGPPIQAQTTVVQANEHHNPAATEAPADAAAPTPNADPKGTVITGQRTVSPAGSDPLSPSPQHAGPSPTGPADLVYTINVSGLGTVDATPDMAVVRMAINAKDPSVQVARQPAATLATQALQTLVSLGVPNDDVNTSNFSITPRYDHANGEPYLSHYEVIHSITVKLRNLDAVGSHIDSLSAAIGNDLAIHSLHFDFQDPTTVLDQARDLAVDDAHRKARQIALSSQRTL